MTETIPTAASGTFTFDDYARPDLLKDPRNADMFLRVEWWVEHEEIGKVVVMLHVKFTHDGESESGVCSLHQDTGEIRGWPWQQLIGWESDEGSLKGRMESELDDRGCAVCHRVVLTGGRLCSEDCETTALEMQAGC